MRKAVVVGILLLIWLLASWSLFIPGFFRVHDYVHAARVAEIGRAFADGHVPPRWSANFGFGYGMPLFEFYAPLPFAVGAVFAWLGIPILLVVKLLFLIPTLVTTWGVFKLARQWMGTVASLLATTLIVLAPYRAVNLFVRGAVGEAWGMMTFPWILLGAYQILRGKRGGWWQLLIPLIVLMLSHNLTTLLFVPVSVLFVVGYGLLVEPGWEKIKTVVNRLAQAAAMYALAGGVAAFYLFPALLEKDLTQVSIITAGYFDYKLHFLYIRQLLTPYWGYGGSGWGPDDGLSFFLGWGQLLAGVGAGLVVLHQLIKMIRTRKIQWSNVSQTVMLAGGLAGLAFVMTLGKSLIIWQTLPFLEFVQFPWRWLATATFFLGLATAMTLEHWPFKGKTLLLGGLILVTLIANVSYFRPEAWLDRPGDLYYTDAQKIREHMSNILFDYLPQGVPVDITPATQLVSCQKNNLECQKIETLVNKTQQKMVLTNFSEQQSLTWSVANYPGWQAYVDGQPMEHHVSAQGLIVTSVPIGEHKLSLNFEGTLVRVTSDWISFISVGIVLAISAAQYKVNTKATSVSTQTKTKSRKSRS